MSDRQADLTRVTLIVVSIAAMMIGTFWIIQPFLAATIWATTLVVASWPLLLRIQDILGGRRGLAVAVMTILLLVIVLVPIWLAISTIVAQSDLIGRLITGLPDFRLPAAPDWLGGIPLVGQTLVERWNDVATWDVTELARKLTPYAGTVSQWLLQGIGNLGGLFIQLLLTIAIAAVLYSSGESVATLCRRLGRRIAGERGDAIVILAGQTIRGVALGVVVTAVAQSVVGGIGLLLASVPQVALLTALMLMLCVAQIGPGLVLLPVTIWLFASGEILSGVILALFSAVALTMDNFLRPMLIRRGANLPLAIILVGVIGGLISLGLVGLFIGPVILGVTYTLLLAWIDEQDQPPA